MGYPSSLPVSSLQKSLSKKSEALHGVCQYLSIGRIDYRRYSKCRLILGTIACIYLILLVNDQVSKFVIHLQETDIKTRFSYPMDLENFSVVVNRFRLGILDQQSLQQPMNLRYSKIGFINNAIHPEDLDKPFGLLIVVKSATRNYEKREAIRKSWGSPWYLRNTSLSSKLPTKLVFICGIPKDFVEGEELFPQEQHFNDIVFANFEDNYSNNTYKSILALKWATTEFPSGYQYLLLIDDDMYVNLKNMIPFVRSLRHRKVYKKNDTDSSIPYLSLDPSGDVKSASIPALSNGLYMGTVYGSSYPVRTNILNFFDYGRKWYVTLAEYPFNLYPPYVPGAAIFMSKKTVSDLYYASYFVQHFWIDDVYLGILAYKMGIIPLHNPHFNSKIKGLQKINKTDFLDVMILHGFKCPAQMYDLWHSRNLPKAKVHYC